MTLQEQITIANSAYREGTPIISDENYDFLLEKLKGEIGVSAFKKFEKTLTEAAGEITHEFVIGSLNKVKYGENQLSKWIKKHKIKSLIVSEKIDGCSFVAKYVKGKFVSGASRGDGTTGTDWTTKLKHILPQSIGNHGNITIRGELVLEDGNYQQLGFKNGRNGVVGIMGEDKIVPSKLKLVTPLVYDVLSDAFEAQEIFEIITEYFDYPNFRKIVVTPTIEEDLKEQYNLWKANAKYGMDGLVICSPDYVHENVFKPEGKVAFKVNQDAVKSRVTGIEWRLSKQGALKPVVLIEPVEIDGTTVKRATGYNARYIRENSINTGAIITLLKSGEIIPCIQEVIKKANYAAIPESCPNCGSILKEIGVDMMCTSPLCSTQHLLKLNSLLRDCGVEGASDKSLLNWGIESIYDFLAWKPDTSKKSQMSFVEQLNKHFWSKTDDELFSNMTFDGAGAKTLIKLIEFYGKDALQTMMVNSKIPDEFPEGIGQKTFEKMRDSYIENMVWLSLICSDKRWKPIKKEKPVTASTGISGKSFCITGTLSKPRKHFETLITSSGGTIWSVSKNLDYLVVGEDSGSKLDKAKKLGINIISEEELYKLIG